MEALLEELRATDRWTDVARFPDRHQELFTLVRTGDVGSKAGSRPPAEMELNFTPFRVAALLALVGGLALFGGLVIPAELAPRDMRSWGLTRLLYVLGAVAATVVDHWVGILDRSNLRWFYVVVGACAMAMAVLLGRGLGSAVS